MDPKEKAVVEAFVAAQKACDDTHRALEQYFRPLVEKTLLTHGVERAAEIVGRCPDSVARVFLQDTLRQAALGHLPKVKEKPKSVLTYRMTIPVKTKGDAKSFVQAIEVKLARAVRHDIEKHVGPVRRWNLVVWVQDIELDAVKAIIGTRAFGLETFTS